MTNDETNARRTMLFGNLPTLVWSFEFRHWSLIRHSNFVIRHLSIAVAAALLINCRATPPKPPPVPATLPVALAPAPKPPPFFLHLPGIGGKRRLDTGMVRAFQQGGFTGEVEIYDWTGQVAGLKALLDTERDKQQAKIVAEILTRRFDADPSARIILCSHSGGGGIAVWALEDLPARVKIDTLLLLAPALSPRYDLSNALSHVSGRAYVFSSDQDPVLGLGCRMFGTIDGVKTDAGGRVGFTEPAGGDDAEYAKLVPMPWVPAWEYLDNFGDHVGSMTRRFARLALAPLVLEGRMPTTQPTTQPFAQPLAQPTTRSTNGSTGAHP
jgi:pimeloyl-ACP methyl ester carboxylesterase